MNRTVKEAAQVLGIAESKLRAHLRSIKALNRDGTLAARHIGGGKLVSLHHANPGAVSAATVRDAADECIERLQAIPPQALELAALFCALLAILPPRWLPYVSCTVDIERPFGTVITDEAGNIAATGTGKTVEGLATLIATKLSRTTAGCGEVAQ